MGARQTTTTKVTVTRVRTPKGTQASSSNSSNKRGNTNRCPKCGRFL